jgi:diguanylate cyclase (GGDEF)-like protein
MANGNILILNRNPQESAHLEKLCGKIGTAYSSSNLERTIALLESVDFNVLVVDYSLASYSSLKGLLERPVSIVITGLEEKKIKEIISEWPLNRYVDYCISPSEEQDNKAFLRVLKKAADHSLLKIEVENLMHYVERTKVEIKDAYSEIKEIKNFVNDSVIRELEKRLELEAKHVWFKKEKQKIEKILKNIYVANDVTSLLDTVHDIKGIIQASGISIYILDEDETLGKYLKPLVWDDAFLLHPDISKHIVLIDSQDFAAFVARYREDINITDLSNDIRLSKRYLEQFKPPLKNILCVPIMHDQEVIGVLEVYDKMDSKNSNQEGFTKEDQQIMRTLSEHISLAITKLNLIQYDALTGLLRPDPFYDNVIQKLESQRKGREEKESYAMVMGDVDWFKNYNDRNGHEAGNRLLRELANALKSATRDQDLLCRYGGEEFLFFLTGLKDLEEACLFTERIRKNIEEHYFKFQEYQPRKNLTMSFGITYLTKERIDSQELITKSDLKKMANEADIALAEAKGKESAALGARGKKDSSMVKNRVCVYYGKATDELEKEGVIRPFERKLLQERRRFERFYTSTVLIYKKNSARKVARTINISLVGVKVSSESELPLDQTLDLMIVMKDKAYQFKGDVVYSEKVEKNFFRYYAGLKFIDLSPEDKTILEDYFSSLNMEDRSSLPH